jgi:hypothetical protein
MRGRIRRSIYFSYRYVFWPSVGRWSACPAALDHHDGFLLWIAQAVALEEAVHLLLDPFDLTTNRNTLAP